MNIRHAVHSGNNWTLFLDRDGVLNKRPGAGYVTHPAGFIWLPRSLQAVVDLNKIFRRIIVVTNQQGIGKAIMTEDDLRSVHEKMMMDVKTAGGKIDAIYHAGGLRYSDSFNRKPSAGMFLQAQRDFPDIDPDASIMAGDTFSDMMFGHRLCIYTALISQTGMKQRLYRHIADFRFNDLSGFASFFSKQY